ncbi:PREDICTED: PRUPE_1G375400 [Prunus dulcis]|uniref:PREDICTED: PRUPE_1G375400 n=1 Tax=Prunus dulcis TaxID=3755 RepID=A0A5E4F489_PRUDU|nr:PREDICTED: PRUPE_1G375400 [Prunus dulcis]
MAARESEYLQVGDVVLFVCNSSVDCGGSRQLVREFGRIALCKTQGELAFRTFYTFVVDGGKRWWASGLAIGP